MSVPQQNKDFKLHPITEAKEVILVEGSLLDRGIGFYLTYEEVHKMQEDAPGGPWWVDPNPGHAIGFTLGAIYVAWPLDFIPDFVPVIGYLDDAAILNLSITVGGWLWDLMD